MAKEIIYDENQVTGGQKDFTSVEKDNQRIKLNKKVYVNKTTNEFIDRAFSEFFKSAEAINVESFFSIYRELFYKISKEGKFSHHYLVKKSKEYIDDYFDPLDKEIEKIIATIERHEQILFEHQNASQEEHLFYPNRTFLKSIVTNPDGLPIWVMQDGAKREIENYNSYKTLKRCFGHTYNTPDSQIIEELDSSTLDEIWDGPPIKSDKDINTQEFDAIDLDFNIHDFVEPGYIKAKITCLEGGIQDPDGYAPPFAYYNRNIDECYYAVEAYNLGSENEELYGDLADQYTDGSGPGIPRISTRNLAPGDSDVTFFRKQEKWSWKLERVNGYMGVEIIENSNKDIDGPVLGDPVKMLPNRSWVDNNGNEVRRYYELPGTPLDEKSFKKSIHGTEMIQPDIRKTDVSKFNPFAWYGDEDHLDYKEDWEKKAKGQVLDNWKNIYYDKSMDWNLLMSINPKTGNNWQPIPGLGNWGGGVYGLPIVRIRDAGGIGIAHLFGHSHGFHVNQSALWDGRDGNKKKWIYNNSRYITPIGTSKSLFGGIYWFLPVDKSWTGTIKPIGVYSQNMKYLTSGHTFTKDGKKFKDSPTAYLAYPGFDNWSSLGWNIQGDPFFGKGNGETLL